MTTTYVAAAAGEAVTLQIETATPGTYSAPMSINLARNIELTATAEATLIPRTDNPAAPGYTSRTVTGWDWKATGAGITNIGDDLTYATWLSTGAVKNVKFANANTGGLILTGPAVCTSCTPLNSGGLGKKADFSITVECAGLAALSAST